MIIKKTNLFMDTSGWLAIMGKYMPFHQAASQIYRKAVGQKRGLVTTNYVMAELVALAEVRLRMGRKHLLAAIDTLMGSPNLTIVLIDQALHLAAWQMLKQYDDKEWSWVDAASFIVMRQHGLTDVLTNDHHFTQAGFNRLLI